jgi:hypothetical protein
MLFESGKEKERDGNLPYAITLPHKSRAIAYEKELWPAVFPRPSFETPACGGPSG